MTRGDSSHPARKKKKEKIKCVSYTPKSHKPAASSSQPAKEALRHTSFKLVNGRFKLSQSVHMSTVNAVGSTQDPISGQKPSACMSWDDIGDTNGWDPAYVASFLEAETLPPQSDPEVPQTQKARAQGDSGMHEWKKEVESFLKTMITLEGRGGGDHRACRRCSTSDSLPEYRCLTCCNMELVCRACLVSTHKHLPFHRAQFWNGAYFTKCSMKSLGLRIQLGHAIGETCPLPSTTWNDDFVVIDTDGIHNVGVDYCGCGHTGKSHATQLLEYRLYPATVTSPKSAATFRLLEVLEILQYESKVTTYEFFQTLTRLTDNTGLNPPKDRYLTLRRMMHQWRYLKLLKRSGRGHDPDRAASDTLPGECALLCPPCPHPGINMAEGWEEEPPETKYIHALNIGLDCNFRLKRKNVSNDKADPCLNKGCAYFVEDEAFRSFLKKHENEAEPKSTCSRHNAVNLADVQPGQSYAASGVGTVECTRHNSKRPNAVCDTQKGERYCNMDYITIMSLYLSLLQMLLISYDIACQWFIHLLERIAAIDRSSVLLKPETTIRFMVPKFHLPAHIPACRTRFAFMLTPGAGLCDGEAPERGWSDTNHLGPSTREMGPGSRRDTLDGHFGDYNWRKIVRLGPSLLRKLENAALDLPKHVLAYQETTASVNPEQIAEWTRAITEWEKDRSQPNPYESIFAPPTAANVRKELALEEKKAMESGQDKSVTDACSPSRLITWGLELEADQRELKSEAGAVWQHSQDRQLARMHLNSNALVRHIEEFYQSLQLYIPATFMLRQRHTPSKNTAAFDIPLWLPSAIGNKAPFDRHLGEIEFRLRTAQAHEALAALRQNLQRRATHYDTKDRWVRNQGANTRALNTISGIERHINDAKHTYRVARSALLSLAEVLSVSDVPAQFPELKDVDVRSMADGLDGEGETRRTMSWIWRHGDAVAEELNKEGYAAEAARIEWAKCRARALRHEEEIKIVKEEMNRTLRFFQYQETQWNLRGNVDRWGSISPEYAEGLQAYAEREAALCRSFRDSLNHQWNGVDQVIARTNAEVAQPSLYYARVEREQLKANRKVIFAQPLTAEGALLAANS